MDEYLKVIAFTKLKSLIVNGFPLNKTINLYGGISASLFRVNIYVRLGMQVNLKPYFLLLSFTCIKLSST